jgi:hypothetical protein
MVRWVHNFGEAILNAEMLLQRGSAVKLAMTVFSPVSFELFRER